MPQYRQSGTDRFSVRGGSASDHVAIGIRNGVGGGATQHHGKTNRWRRSVRPERIRRLGIGTAVFVLCLVLVVTVLAYYYISGFANNDYDDNKGSFVLLCLALFRLFLISCIFRRIGFFRG